MKKQKLTIMFLAILGCSLTLMGCKDTERDALKAELATVTEARDKLQKQVSLLITLQSKAAAKDKVIDKLRGQLQEQTKKAIALQEQNKKLQETIDSLQEKLGGEVKIPELPKL